MSSPWSNTVDRALRTTNETLERLQRAEVSYEHARTRLFPGERSPLDERNASRAGARRVDVPPPLPRSRYQASSSPVVGRAVTIDTVPMNVGLASEAVALGSVQQSQNLLGSQLQTVVAELALERVARTESINELRALHQHQLAALTSSVTQLKDENEYLRRSVRALETRQAYQRGLRSGADSLLGPTDASAPFRGGYASLNGASGFADGSQLPGGGEALLDAKVNFLSSAANLADVKQRLTLLETAVRGQKERLDSRHERGESSTADLVKAQVAVEVERMRSIAREAARDATDDLVKLRLNAIQSMFNAELQKVLETTGISQEVSSTTERQFRRLERDWDARLTALESDQRTVRAEQSAVQKQRDESGRAEAALQDTLRALQDDVGVMKRQSHEDALRYTKLVDNKVDGCRAATMIAVTQLLDDREQQRRGSTAPSMSEAEVRRLLETSTAPLHAALEQCQSATQRNCDRLDATTQQLVKRVATLETAQRAHDEGLAEVQDRVTRVETEQGVQREAAQALQQTQRTAHSAVQELAATLKATSAETEALEARQQADHKTQSEALRGLQKEHSAALTEMARHHAETTQSTAATLSELSTAVTAVQQEQRRLVAGQTAKLDALKSHVEETCAQPVQALQIHVSALAGQQKQLQDSKAYQETVIAQQLSDITTELGRRAAEAEANARRYTEHVRDSRSHAHDILAQRVATLEKDAAVAAAAAAAAPTERETSVPALMEATCTQLVQRVTALEQRPAALPPRSAPPENAVGPDAQKPAVEPTAAAVSVRDLDSVREQLAEVTGRTGKLEAAQEDIVDALRAAKESVGEVQRGLQRVEARVEEDHHRVDQSLLQQRGEWRGQLQRQENFTKEQMTALSEHVESLVNGANAMAQSSVARVRESLAPLRVAASFATDTEAAEQLAGLLEPHLHAVRHVQETLSAVQQEQQQQRGLLVEAAAAAAATAAAAVSADKVSNPVREAPATDSSPVPAVEVQALATRLTAVEEDVEARDESLKATVQALQDSTTAAHTAQTEALAHATEAVRAHDARLADLGRAQTELGRTQERLAALEEALREAQEAALQPLRIKVRTVEANVTGLEEIIEQLRNHLGDAGKTCLQRHEQDRQELAQLTASTSAGRDELCRQLLSTVQERHALLEGQLQEADTRQREALQKQQRDTEARLEPLTQQVETLAASTAVTRAAPTLPDEAPVAASSLAEILDPIDEQLQQLQAQLDDVLARGLVPTLGASAGTAAVAPVGDLAERVAAVEARLAELKDSEDTGLQVTADALGSLSDSLQRCVERVRQELQRGRLWSDSSRGDGAPAVEALDDIFVFVVQQLGQVFYALSALQESAISSLEMIQQQELDVLALAPLQQAVVDLVRRLEPVARAVGVDPATLQVDVGPLVPQLLDDAEASAIAHDDGDESGSLTEL